MLQQDHMKKRESFWKSQSEQQEPDIAAASLQGNHTDGSSANAGTYKTVKREEKITSLFIYHFIDLKAAFILFKRSVPICFTSEKQT